MRRIFFTGVLLWLMGSLGYAQGIEIYGGYFNRMPSRSPDRKVQNWKNGSAGINATVYIRSVAIQSGIGYMSNNYTIDYAYRSNLNDRIRGTVSNFYIYMPLMVYPRVYADGKNALSIGVGAKFIFPGSKPVAYVTYEDGTTKKATMGTFVRVVMPRVAFRYSRFFGRSFLFFADLHTDITVMDSFREGSPGHGLYSPIAIPWYNSPVTLGLNVGLGYVLPIDGVKQPRYFLKRVKKE